MAKRLTADQVLLALDSGDFGLSDEEDSDYEGEDICGYLLSGSPEADLGEDPGEDAQEEDRRGPSFLMDLGGCSSPGGAGLDSDLSKSTILEARV